MSILYNTYRPRSVTDSWSITAPSSRNRKWNTPYTMKDYACSFPYNLEIEHVDESNVDRHVEILSKMYNDLKIQGREGKRDPNNELDNFLNNFMSE